MLNHSLSEFLKATKSAASYNSIIADFLAHASRVAYRNKNTIESMITATCGLRTNGQNFCFLDNPNTNTQGFIIADDNLIIIVFRGTEPSKIEDWASDADFALIPYENDANISVHAGFYSAFNSVKNEIEAFINQAENQDKTIWLAGHSLRGALAALTAFWLKKAGKEIGGIYTFGQPRVGNIAFATAFDGFFLDKAYRLVNNNDVVPRLPMRCLEYSHSIGRLVYIDSDGLVRTNLSFWKECLDRVEGVIKHVLAAILSFELHLPDGIDDHDMKNYIQCVQKAQNQTVSHTKIENTNYPL